MTFSWRRYVRRLLKKEEEACNVALEKIRLGSGALACLRECSCVLIWILVCFVFLWNTGTCT
jgi:hypothetical protein